MVPSVSSLRPAVLANQNMSHTVSLDLGFIKANIGCSETKTDGNSTPNILYYPNLIKHRFLLQNLALIPSRLSKKVIWKLIKAQGLPVGGKLRGA